MGMEAIQAAISSVYQPGGNRTDRKSSPILSRHAQVSFLGNPAQDQFTSSLVGIPLPGGKTFVMDRNDPETPGVTVNAKFGDNRQSTASNPFAVQFGCGGFDPNA